MFCRLKIHQSASDIDPFQMLSKVFGGTSGQGTLRCHNIHFEKLWFTCICKVPHTLPVQFPETDKNIFAKEKGMNTGWDDVNISCHTVYKIIAINDIIAIINIMLNAVKMPLKSLGLTIWDKLFF